MDQLVRELPRGRLRHVLGVAGTAAELAERFGADPQKARTAGLLHDIVRLWPPERLLAACQERGLSLSDFDLEHPVVRLHGLLASHLAEEWFGIEDADIKAAIASHTVGRPQMSRLERILYVADYCEPSRGPQAEDVRVAARNDLDAAVRLAMDRTIAYLLERGRAIHPEAVAARNAFLGDSMRAGPTPRSGRQRPWPLLQDGRWQTRYKWGAQGATRIPSDPGSSRCPRRADELGGQPAGVPFQGRKIPA